MRKVVVAIAIGIMVTLALLGLEFAADALGYPGIARVLFWHNSVLQSFVPLYNIGSAAHPVYEGTPLNFLAFCASIPLGFVIYGVLAYVALRFVRGGT